jgi:hypothetical protein
MKIGIVGSEGAKFTELGEQRAKGAILDILKYLVPHSDDAVVSGACHLGGIDIWAEELADKLGIGKEIYPPKEHSWSGGYKPRNLQIARNSDIIYCITVDKLPPDYKGMTFETCYHCAKNGRDGKNHVKSGGCWTVIQGIKMGKEGRWVVISNQ